MGDFFRGAWQLIFDFLEHGSNIPESQPRANGYFILINIETFPLKCCLSETGGLVRMYLVNIALKRFIASWRALPIAAMLLLASRDASGQLTAVSDWDTLHAALETSSVITNFVTNSVISLSSVLQTFEISNSVVIDGGTNNVVIDGSSAVRLFHVRTNAQLILNNLQLLNGISIVGGAILNEGVLIISNSIISGNGATNVTGVNGAANTSGGDGNSATSGGEASGGAIYSTGSLSIYYSVLGTNSAYGGDGGQGGAGGGSPLFGGNGGNGGSGGSALGAAIFSSGSNNVFYFDEFIDNQCIAGNGGNGGAAGSGSFDAGNSGQGGTGGSAVGGALYIAGNMSMNGCLFYFNGATGGASAAAQVTFDGSGSSGNGGGEAVGGGLFISDAASHAGITNTVFFENTCGGGGGGSAPGQSATGGNGGAAIGGGLDSGAAHMVVRFCTLATNILRGGTNGTGSGGSGSVGGTAGWDICANTGGLELSDSILSGGTNQAPNYKPNAFGVADAGYNVSSDASMAKITATTLVDADTGLDSVLSGPWAGLVLGPTNVASPAMLTLALLGGPAAGFIPGVAGVSFPATDQQFQPRGSPTSAGAFEVNALVLSTNISSPTITTQPISQTNAIGTEAMFTVQVSDTNAVSYGYQWQFNNTNLTDSANFAGTTTSNLTIKRVSLTNQGAYHVVVGVSTLQGVTISANANLSVIAPPKITVQPAKKPVEPAGAIVSLTVTATGTTPMFYQWRDGTTSLIDTNEISGSMTDALVINSVAPADNGTYSVVISNVYGVVTSAPVTLKINPDKTRPTVSITSPAASSRTTNTVIAGKATDNARVYAVFWSMTNINAGSNVVTSGFATLGSGTTVRTWSISNAVAPGTNIVRVQSFDPSGNVSPIVTRKFFNVAPSIFELAVNGPGAVKGHAAIAGNVPPTNGALLNIGEGYTLTAAPAKNAVFSNWTSNGVPSTASTLHFIMQPGLQIAANFASSDVVHADEVNVYNGLFYDETNGVTEKTAGMLSQLTVNNSGAYSGKLWLDGSNYSVAGKFDASGVASSLIARPAEDGGPVKVLMALQETNAQIRGVVSGSGPGTWTSTLFAVAAGTNADSSEHMLLLLPSTNANVTMPQGGGYLLLTNHLGQLVYRGLLADATAFSQATSVSRFGDAPLFANLYGNTGLLLGWIGLSNGTIQAETPLAWIKLPSASGPYPAGFTNLLSVTNQALLQSVIPPDSNRQ
jgi:hypothetical protein